MLNSRLLSALALIGFTNGASLGYTSMDCGQQEFQCLMEMIIFTRSTIQADMQNPKNVQQFTRSCGSILNCFDSLQCRRSDENFLSLTSQINSFCESVSYLNQPRGDCQKKLAKQNKNCVVHYPCEDFFNQNNCDKNAFVQTCGPQEWTKVRDSMIALKTLIYPSCNMDKWRDY